MSVNALKLRGGRPIWRVTVKSHTVGRHEVPAAAVQVTAPDAASARVAALRLLHARVGVPPLKSMLRLSWPYASAGAVKLWEGGADASVG